MNDSICQKKCISVVVVVVGGGGGGFFVLSNRWKLNRYAWWISWQYNHIYKIRVFMVTAKDNMATVETSSALLVHSNIVPQSK